MRLPSRLAALMAALIGVLTIIGPAFAHPRHAHPHHRVAHHIKRGRPFRKRRTRSARHGHAHHRRAIRRIGRPIRHPEPPKIHRTLGAVPSPPSVHDALVSMLDGLLASPALKGDHLGFVLMTSSGAVVYARNADERFSPASCRKVMSTACALSLLGPGDRISTQVEAVGSISGSELDGDLHLVGSGDPSLDDAALADLARQVLATGIRTVTGQVVADDSAFEPPESRPGGWSDDDLEWSYAPPISALEADEDRMADPAASGSLDLSAPHPAQFAIERFERALETAGVRIEGQSTPPGTPSRQLVATHLSAPLAELVARTNKPSDNLYAELLLRQLAIAGPWARQAAAAQASQSLPAIGATGSAGPILSLPSTPRPPGTWQSGPALGGLPAADSDTLDRALAIERSWLGFVPGTFKLVDGSGLSRYDLLTPRQLASVLLRMRSNPAFVGSLPVAGRDGTLAHRLLGTPAAGQVRAKTGSMSGVSTLAGYAGDRWILVFMDNGHVGPLSQVRAVQDAICLALVKKP